MKTLALYLVFVSVPQAQEPATKVTELAPGVFFMQMQTQPEFLGCNSGWVIFEDYVLVIDAGFPLSARLVVDEVKRTTSKPIRFVFDTHYHGDHSFGNGVYVALGATGVGHELCLRDQRIKGIVAYARQEESESDLARRQVAGVRFQDATIAFDRRLVFDDGEQRVELLHFGQAHTPGDAVAYLPKHKILFTGDVCVNGSFNYMGDGDVGNWIEVLEAVKQLEARTIAPGHGPLAGPDLLATQQRYFVELRRQVAAGIEAGKSLAEIRDSLDMPFYQEWTGIPVRQNLPNITHVHAELLGLVPPAYLTRDMGLAEGPSPTRQTPGWTPPQKVLVPNVSPGALGALRAVAPGVELVVYRSAEEAARLVSDADAVLGTCTAEIIARGQKLRWIQVGAAGVEGVIDLPGLREGPITLTNTQRIYGPEVADHALALLLALARGLRTTLASQLGDRRWGVDTSKMVELRGKTALIVGLGGIGTEVARRAHAFGMRVLAVDPKPLARPDFVFQLAPPDRLLDLVPLADAVLNCAPLTESTTGLYGREFFGAMKPTAFFVSIGRGESTDSAALAAALREGRIAGAGLDVTDPEPLPPDHELWRLANVVITPHIASRSDHREDRRFDLYRENLRRFAAGEPLLGVVDKAKGY